MLLAVDAHVEHRGLESLAAALVARHEHVGHEDHLDLEIAGALARLATAAGDVEAERARGVPALARQRSVGEDASDLVERLHVRDGIRPRRLADRTLVDDDDVVDRFDAGERVVMRRRARRGAAWRRMLAVKLASRARAAARRERACSCRSPRRRSPTVTAPSGILMSTPLRLCSRAPVSVIQRGPTRRRSAGTGISRRAGEVRAGERALGDARDRAREHELAAFLAASGPELDHVIGGANRLRIVLDDEHRVAAVAQAMQQPEQPVHVARMQTDRRLVEHVERVDELRAERVGEADALRLAAGERARARDSA